MRLYLINPRSPLISLTNVKHNRWNRYRIWKPLGLLVLAGLTPAEWQITVIDENLRIHDYALMPRPDLVGITAFTSQANRAYEVADEFRCRDVPVVMGGIHATMCQQEALQHADSVVTGEAENVWAEVLRDAQAGRLLPIYMGGYADMASVPPARHDLLPSGYAFGAIQTTRGCPLNCDFCSVSAFNGNRYRLRPIDNVIREFGSIPEKRVFVVDDNLIGTTASHLERAKELFRAMIQAKVNKDWFAQVTVNMADDEDLLRLAASAAIQVMQRNKTQCRPNGVVFPCISGYDEYGKRLVARLSPVCERCVEVSPQLVLSLSKLLPPQGLRSSPFPQGPKRGS